MTTKFIFSWIGISFLFYSSISSAQNINDCSSFKYARQRGSVVTYSTNHNQTIRGLQNGDSLFLGAGQFPHFTLNDLSNFTLKSSCSSLVQSVTVKQSDNIRIEGLDITDSSNERSGIFLGAGVNSNSFVTLINNKVHGDVTRSGIIVRNGNSNIAIENNEIYDNENGISVQRGASTRPILIKNNHIYNNNKNGILITDNPILRIEGNLIEQNGQGTDSDNGYGIKRNRNEPPVEITLVNNTIKNNRGRIITNRSSIDLGNFASLLDSGDSGNTTTAGNEGHGVSLSDTMPPVVTANISNGQKFVSSNQSINVTVVDANLLKSDLFLNGTFIYTSNQGAFSRNLNLLEGTNLIQIQSVDTFGNQSVLNISNVLVDSVLPSIQSNLSSNLNLNNATFNLIVNAVDANFDKSLVFVNGLLVEQNSLSSFSKDITLQEGTNSVSIQSFDTFGNQRTVFYAGINLDTVLPIIQTSFESGVLFSNNVVDLDITVNESNYLETNVYVNDQFIGRGVNTEFTITLNLLEGNNEVRIEAFDIYGNQTTKTLSNIFVDSAGPQLSINYNSGDSVYLDQSKIINFVISSSELTQFVSVNGMNAFGLAQDFYISLTLDDNQSQNFLFVAQDYFGNVSTTTITLNVLQDNDRPIITLNKNNNIFTNNQNFDLTINVQDSGIAKTRIFLNGSQIIESEALVINADMSLNLGRNRIEVTSIDRAGNIATPKTLDNIDFNNIPIAITVSTPLAGDEITEDSFLVAGSSSKELTSISVNGTGLSLSSDAKQFSGQHSFTSQTGELNLNILAQDKWGNTTSTIVPVFIKDIVQTNLAYITDSENEKIHVYNSDDFTKIKEISLSQDGSSNSKLSYIELSVDKKSAYVVRADDEKLDIINLTDEVVTNTYDVNLVNAGADANNPLWLNNSPLSASEDGLFIHFAKAYVPPTSDEATNLPEPEQLGGILIVNTQNNQSSVANIPSIKPGSVVASLNGDKLYMTTGLNSIVVVDPQTGALVETINVGTSQFKSNNLVLSNDGSHIYVSSSDSNLISKINLSTKQLVQTIDLGGEQVALSRIGSGEAIYALVNKSGIGSLLVIDEGTSTVANELVLGAKATKMKTNLTKSQIWVTLAQSNQVKLIDRANLTVINTLTVNAPMDVAFGYINNKSQANIPPLANFIYSPNSSVAPVKVSFDGTKSRDLDGSIQDYHWEINGTQFSTTKPSYRFTSPGVYDVSLTVKDNANAERTKTVQIEIGDKDALPSAIFYAAADNNFGLFKARFDASQSYKTGGSISSYVWDFGDGKAGNGKIVTHEYSDSGTYLATLVVTDSFGKSATSTKAVSVTDVTPLNLTILSPQPGILTNQSAVQISGTIDEVSTFIKVNGVQVLQNPDKSFVAHATLTEQGVNVIPIEAVDGSGNVRTINFPVVYDTVAPIYSNLIPQGASTLYQRDGIVNFSVTANEALRSITANGNNLLVNNNSQRVFEGTSDFVTSGTKNITFLGEDLAGNPEGYSLTFNLVVDTTAPVLSFASEPPQLTNNPQLSLSILANDESPTTIEVKVNSSSIVNGSIITLSEGINQIYAKAIDSAGNFSEITRTVHLDAVSPVLQISLSTDSLTNQQIIQATGRAYDLGGTTSGLYLNGSLVQSSTLSEFTVSLNLIEGENIISLTSRDEAGNIAVAAQKTVTRDTAPPILSNIKPSDQGTIGLKALLLPIYAESNEPLRSLLVNGNPLGTNILDLIFSDIIAIQGDGAISLTYVATDMAGNISTVVKNITTSLDNADPIITITGVTDNQLISNPNLPINITVQDSSTAKVQIFVNNKFVFEQNSNSFSYTLDLVEGINSIKVRAVDSVERSAEKTVSGINLDSKKPILTFSSPTDGQEFTSNSIVVSFTSNEPLSSAFINGTTYPLSGVTSFTQTITVTTTGGGILAVQATDVAGNATTRGIPYVVVEPGSPENPPLTLNTNNLHTCTAANGAAYCFGWNGWGQLGDNSFINRSAPIIVPTLGQNVKIAKAGAFHSCAVLTNNTMKCWGRNDFGELGNRATGLQGNPVSVVFNSPLVINDIALGNGFTCIAYEASQGDGVKCWGRGNLGMLGQNSTSNSLVPVDAVGLSSNVRFLATSSTHVCAVKTDDSMYCWGDGQGGRLGNGSNANALVPTLAQNFGAVSKVAIGVGHTCALQTDGDVICLGSNNSGQAGSTAGTPLNLGQDATDVSAGISHSCAILADQSVKCWGAGAAGELGNGTFTTSSPTPVNVVSLGANTGSMSISSSQHTCVMLPTAFKCWGRNTEGQLGDGTFTNKNVPVTVLNLIPPPPTQAPIIANFTANPNRTFANLNVNFDASSTVVNSGSISSYQWNFGDSTTATGLQVSHNYQSYGNYLVELTVVSGTNQQYKVSKYVVVDENIAPVPKFTHNLNIVSGISTVSFDASSSFDSDGSITNYAWSFGDGGVGNGANVAHQYASEGTYSVTLTVTSNSNQEVAATKSIVVKDVIAPILSVSSPIANSKSKRSFIISGTSDEKLQSLKLNGVTVALNADQISFNRSFSMNRDELINLNLEAMDLSGNKSNMVVPVEFDSTGPVLTIVKPNSNSVVYSIGNIQIEATSNEKLSSASAGGFALNIAGVDGKQIIGSISTQTEGYFTTELEAFDELGNRSVKTIQYRHELDTVQPVLSVTPSKMGSTNTNNISLNINATDKALDRVEVYQNGVKVNQSSSGVFVYTGLLANGENTFLVKAYDQAENVTEQELQAITYDTEIPSVFITAPTPNSTLFTSIFSVTGSVSEPLSALSIAGTPVLVGNDNTFIANVETNTSGLFSIAVVATDLAGNQNSFLLPLTFDLILVPQLVSVIDIKNGSKLLVRGAEGATKPGAEVTVKSGLLNIGRATSDVLGKFEIEMSPFSSAEIQVDYGGHTAKAPLQYTLKTRIAGVIKNINNQTLSGVRVGVSGSDIVTTTDVAGAFNIDNPPTGDQKLIVDASVLNTDYIQYSNVEVAVNIGFNRPNILEKPIYLAPLVIDSSSVLVTTGGGAILTNPNVAGVRVYIPSGTTSNFPDGSTSGRVSISKTLATMAIVPVPDFAVPNEIIHLEPSGLKFDKPVELSLPNDNELPAGVELAIMSMDTDKGTWEIDGLAKVSPNGNTIKTKLGEGITHFSPKYAVPIGPVIRAYGKTGEQGINTLEGGVTRTVEMPGFKSLGKEIKPTLMYNSNWAKPTAIVTNYFAMPERQISSTGIVNYGSAEAGKRKVSYTTSFCYSDDENNSTKKCFDDFLEYWKSREFESFVALQQTAWYEPTNIKSKFYISGLTTDEISQDLETSQPNIIDEATWGQMPSQTLVSFGADLVDSNSNYFKTGIYPSLSHYDLQLKSMVISTRATIETVEIENGRVRFIPPTIKKTTSLESGIDQLIPQDITSPVYVQNRVNSNVGRGWRIAGLKKIINPESNRIALEEDSGGISLYNADYAISTVLDVSGQDYDLTGGVSFHSWPYVALSKKISGASSAIYKHDLSIPGSQGIKAGADLPKTSGHLKTAQLCPVGQLLQSPSRSFAESRWNYTVSRDIKGLMLLDGGDYYATDANEHSLFVNQGGQFVNLLRYMNPAPDQRSTYSINNVSSLNSFCRANFKSSCRQPSGVSIAEGCPNNIRVSGDVIPEVYYRYKPHQGTFNFQNTNVNTFTYPVSSTTTLNSPMGITAGPDGEIYVADFGGNRVIKFNRFTSTMTVVAGNMSLEDSGDGGHALNAGIYHPRGLTFDDAGNLYVTTERGYVRKIDTVGTITTYAGVPLGSIGSLLEDSVDAEQLALGTPTGIIVDSAKQMMFVADTKLNRIVQINMLTKKADLIAGSGETCGPSNIGDGGSAISACLSKPTWIGFDNQKNILVADSGNNRIRKIGFPEIQNLAAVYKPVKRDNSILKKLSDGTFLRIHRNGNLDSFNNEGLIISSGDRAGREVIFSYNSSKEVESITDPVGQTIQFSYSGGKVMQITSPGGTTELSYSSGELTNIEFPNGTQKKYLYSQGLLSEERDERNIAVQYQYNEYNRLSKTIMPDNSEILSRDHLEGTYIDPNINLKKMVSMDGEIYGQLTSAEGQTIIYDKDINGYIKTVTDSLGNQTTITMDLYGQPEKVVKPNGAEIISEYDKLTGDLKKSYDSATGETKEYDFDDFGNVIREEINGKVTTRDFSPNTGLLIQENMPNGNISTYSYGMRGLVSSVTTKINSTESYTRNFNYDPKGNVIYAADSFNKEVNNSFDGAGNILTSSEKTSSGQYNTFVYTYDSFNRLLSVKTPKNEVTQYIYSSTGKLSKVKDPQNQEVNYVYDIFDRVASMTNQLNQVTSYNYDSDGNLLQMTDAKNQVVNYSYDTKGRMIQAVYPDDLVKYAYNINDKVIKVENNKSRVQYSYDNADRVIGIQVAGLSDMSSYPTINQSFTYNWDNQRLTLSDNTGTSVTYSYTNDGKLQRITDSQGFIYSYSHDLLNRITQMTLPGMVSSYVFNNRSGLTNIDYSSGGVTRAYFNYSRNDKEQVLQESSDRGTTLYAYDTNNQLTGVTKTFSQVRGPASLSSYNNETFQYDNIGNRMQDSGGSYTYSTNKQQLTENWKYRFVYDANGNMSDKYDKQTNEYYKYEYNSKNQLVRYRAFANELSTQAIIDASYAYDALGRRMGKAVLDNNNPADKRKTYTRFYGYDGDEMYLEFDVSSNLLARYLHSNLRSDDTLSVQVTSAGVDEKVAKNSGTYNFLKDQLGSITHIASTNGNVVQKLDYSSFGVGIRVTDAEGNDVSSDPNVEIPFAFANREIDRESGLYYNRARYYDPELGRFLQRDPHPGKAKNPISIINKYGYANNNPISYVDPNGKFGFLVAILWTAAYSAGVSAIQAGIQTGWGEKSDFWKAFGLNFAVNFAVSLVGLFSFGVQNSFANFASKNYQLGWGGVYNADPVLRGFSAGFFQATNGTKYLHELGHTINFAILGSSWNGRESDNDSFWQRVAGASGFYITHGLGSFGGKFNPFTYLTEGLADIWGWDFSETVEYTK